MRIPGIDASVEIELSRIGMAQTLAYELRGPLEHGPAIYDIVYRAGKEFGIKRLGWRHLCRQPHRGRVPTDGMQLPPVVERRYRLRR